MDNFRDRGGDPSLREAWRKAVPALAAATSSEDGKVRHGAIMILSLLGPEARDALPTMSSLAHETQDAAVRSAAENAIKSISCIDDLKAKDPSVRIAATEILGRLGWRAAAGRTRSDCDIVGFRHQGTSLSGERPGCTGPDQRGGGAFAWRPRSHVRPTRVFGLRSWKRWKRLHREPPPFSVFT